MTLQDKLNLVTNYFSDDWSIDKAMQLLEDYDKVQHLTPLAANGGVVGWLPVHFNGYGFYGGPLKTEAEANQYIAQVHQSNDSVTLTARPFTWVTATPTTSVRAEALRLAEALELYATGDKHQRDIEEAAAELRRLHAARKQGDSYE